MLESLERIAERLRQPPSISVEVEKIREQIAENKAVNVDLEKLQPSYDTLKQRGEEMISRSEGADKDLSAKSKHSLQMRETLQTPQLMLIYFIPVTRKYPKC